MGGKVVFLYFFGDPGSWQFCDTILSWQTEFKYHFYFGAGIVFFEKGVWEKPVLIRPVLGNFPYMCMTLLCLPYCLH